MIEWLENWLTTDDTKIIYILVLILISNLIDFSIGWLKAKCNPEIVFQSSMAVFGIARKIVMFILLIVFIPFSLLMPNGIGIGSLYILYMGYLSTEIISIMNHLGLTKDDKDSRVFHDFVSAIILKGGNKNDN